MSDNEFRTLVVQGVFRGEERVAVTFYDCTTSLDFPPETLSAKGLQDIKAGDVIQIKGRRGNEDVSLARPDPLMDFHRLYRSQ